jgi:iron complex transport system substrate-binding protein
VPRRAPGLLLTLLAAPGLWCGCSEAKPWHATGWRPDAPPQRIVAASVFAAEVLLAIAPRERIAAVHVLAADARFSPVAAMVAGLRTVGAEPEQLLAVRPDLVICDAFTKPETIALLAAAKTPVVRTATASSFADIAANIRTVARVCHLEAPAEELVGTMQAGLAALAARAPDVAAWRMMSLDGALDTCGAGSLFDAVVTAAGATNVAARRGIGPFRKLDLEAVLAWRPDALVPAGVGERDTGVPAWILQNPGLRLLPCVQKERVVHVPGALLECTSHRIVDAVRLVQDQLLAWGRP